MTAHAILTAAEMRAAEAAAIAAGTSVETLMDRAGTAAAEAIWRYAGRVPALVLCGPGNNGGDGYVVARRLRERGADVRVAALGEAAGGAARAARQGWEAPVETFADARPAPLLVDALFGTGLARPLDDSVAQRLCRLAEAARVRVALDLPSGVAADDGIILSPVPVFDLTVTFATLKPSHRLQPAAGRMGRIVVADIGIAAPSAATDIVRPKLPGPGPGDHKYSRGYVAVLSGEMTGASALAATAALRAGAGYVRLIGGAPAKVPAAVVQGRDPSALADGRIGAIAVGPGLGRGAGASALLARALHAEAPLILDGDALTLLGEGPVDALRPLAHMPIMTPHGGEFARICTGEDGSKIERSRAAAAAWGAVIIHKGADTVVAAPDGRAAVGGEASPWLATAGTGDVLAGVVAAMRARGLDPFEAACAGVWLHGRAARLAGRFFIADDLPACLPEALIECL